MSFAFYLPLDGRAVLGFSSDASFMPRMVRVLPAKDGVQARALSYGLDGADSGCNESGVAVTFVPAQPKFKADKHKANGPDFIAEALKASGGAEAVRNALIALAEEHGLAPGPKGSRFVGGGSYFVAGADGAFLVELAGARWAWKALTGPEAVAGSFCIQDDYKRLDADTRKAIAPVNDRMACLDEADAGRVAEKESWKAYAEHRYAFERRRTRADSLRRAVLEVLRAAEKSGGLHSAFALLRAHGLSDPDNPSQSFDTCSHGGLFAPGGSAAVLYELKPGCTTLWFTGAPWTCANLFKPLAVTDGFTPLWDDYPLDGQQGQVVRAGYWTARLRLLSGLKRSPQAFAAKAASLAQAQAAIVEAHDSYTQGLVSAEKTRERILSIVRSWNL